VCVFGGGGWVVGLVLIRGAYSDMFFDVDYFGTFIFWGLGVVFKIRSRKGLLALKT